MSNKPLLTITLPLPPKALNPNWRGHWAIKAAKVKQCRWESKMMAFCRREPFEVLEKATIQCRFYFRDKRRRDKDNLLASCKAYFDGLADAGLVRDDSQLSYLPVVVEVDKSNPRLVLEVFGEEVDPAG